MLNSKAQEIQRVTMGSDVRRDPDTGCPHYAFKKVDRRLTWLRTEVRPGADGRLCLDWCRDEEAIAEAQRRDGLYALITNLSPQRCSADRLLGLYKDQFLSERAHHFLKGPLAVRPVFLKNNQRAAALVGVCSFALLVYGLV